MKEHPAYALIDVPK